MHLIENSSAMYWRKPCTAESQPSVTGLVDRSVNLCTAINFPPPAFSHTPLLCTSLTSVLFALLQTAERVVCSEESAGKQLVRGGACKVKEARQPGKGETVRWSITPPATTAIGRLMLTQLVLTELERVFEFV